MSESLAAALNDPRAEVRRRALLFVPAADAHDPPLRAALVAALADPMWCVREAAVVAVSRFTDPDGSILGSLVGLTLRDANPHVRLAAALHAGSRVRPERDYGNAVRHHFERQRIRAASALGYVGTERAAEAVSLLALCASDSHPKVRLAALRSLARLDPGAVVSLLPIVVRKCAEADPNIAAAARGVWTHALTHRATETLNPLAPYPGTVDVIGAGMAVRSLPADHPLRGAWDALALPKEANLTPHRFARHLAAVCVRVMAGVAGSPS